MAYKAITIKEKIDKLDFIKVKKFCLSEFMTKSFGKQQNSRTYLQYICQRILAYFFYVGNYFQFKTPRGMKPLCSLT